MYYVPSPATIYYICNLTSAKFETTILVLHSALIRNDNASSLARRCFEHTANSALRSRVLMGLGE